MSFQFPLKSACPHIIIVHLGGNDLTSIDCHPRELADKYVDFYAGAARIVIFSSVVRRSNPRGVNKYEFAKLVAQFNQRLKQRADGVRTLYFRHDRLHNHLAADGVHLNFKGERRLLFSYNHAIAAGRRALEKEPVYRVVFSGAVYTSFE